MSIWRGHPSTIATPPLTGVCLALVLATVPLLDKVAPWAFAIFAAALLLRLMVNRQRLQLPSLPLKILLLALGLGGVAYSYGGLVGVEPGLGILLILLSLKLLETNTVRDFQVLVLLGWFLCLCGLFFAQDLTTWLYLSALGVLLAASLIRFHRTGGFGASFRLSLKLLAQAMPIIVLLFLFFPRTHGGFRFQFTRSPVGVTGMSDRLSPGTFASLTQDDRLAFRVNFPDGDIPPLPQLYWRAAVLWRGDGLTWVRGPQLEPERRLGQLDGERVRQSIIMEPHGGRWLFALDRPASDVPHATFEAGGILQSDRPIMSALRYEVASRPENRELSLLPQQRFEALRKPTRIAPQVQALVDSWRGSAASDRDVAEAALRYFRRENFVYTMTPKPYGDDALSEFLFERRAGFCEHYAAAFASLMRIAGIPSRVVIGYHGGEVNRKSVFVKQLDAHAWAEVWIKDYGWWRVDPTNVIAPDRITSGFESYLQSQAIANNPDANNTSAGALGLREIMHEARLFWDNVKYQWDIRVQNYDEETQRTFLAFSGLGDFTPPVLALWLSIAVLLVLGLLGLWLRMPRGPRPEPLQRDYERYCRLLAKSGVVREPWEGPARFSERAASAHPAHASAIRATAAFYIAARYARHPSSPSDFATAVRAFPKLPAGPRSR